MTNNAEYIKALLEKTHLFFLPDPILNNRRLPEVLQIALERNLKINTFTTPMGLSYCDILKAASLISQEQNQAIVFAFNGALVCVLPSFEYSTANGMQDFLSGVCIMK